MGRQRKNTPVQKWCLIQDRMGGPGVIWEKRGRKEEKTEDGKGEEMNALGFPPSREK